MDGFLARACAAHHSRQAPPTVASCTAPPVTPHVTSPIVSRLPSSKSVPGMLLDEAAMDYLLNAAAGEDLVIRVSVSSKYCYVSGILKLKSAALLYACLLGKSVQPPW